MKVAHFISPLAAALLTVSASGVRAEEPMLEFTVVHADTMIGLSRNTFISPDAWREVARLNHIGNPDVILPGQMLRVPVRLMRSTLVDATLVSVTGDVQIDGKSAAAGATIREGQMLRTGPSSSVVVELADGSRVKLPPSSLAEVAASRTFGVRVGSAINGQPRGVRVGAAGSEQPQGVRVGAAGSEQPQGVRVGAAGSEQPQGVRVGAAGSEQPQGVRVGAAGSEQPQGVRVGAAGSEQPRGVRVGSALSDLPGSMQVASANADQMPGNGWFAGTLRIVQGSVEVFATKVLRAKPLEVTTPTAVVGVRGTHYRVGLDGGTGPAAHAEVLEGVVRFDESGAGINLPAGFGAASANRSQPNTTPLDATPLQPAPDLSTVGPLFERPIVRFSLPSETAPLRVQVAADEAFDRIVSDQRVEPGAEVRIAGLDDAQWYVRARRIDTLQIEGQDTSRAFTLKARPEPPASITPRAGARQTVGAVDFAWTQNAIAPSVHLQVAEDTTFTKLVVDQDSIADSAAHIAIPNPGSYVWRLASIRPNGDRGPYGDPQRFELRALPEPASMARSADGASLIFKWGGRAGDRQQVQLARDAAFTDLISDTELSASEWVQPVPTSSGRYYFRYRSIEADGFVSPYSETLTIDVPRDWRILLLLVPLLIAL